MSHDATPNMPLTNEELDELEAFLASSAVPEDCMNLEMLDGFLTACVCSPVVLPTAQWLQAIWGGEESTMGVAFASQEQAQRILELIMRHWSMLSQVLNEMPTMFKPLLYLGEENTALLEDDLYEGREWCQGFMTGVVLGGDAWAALMEEADTADWLFPIEALAFGEQDPVFAEWTDDEESRASLVEELPIAVVLIHRFWRERADKKDSSTGTSSKRASKKTAKKTRERLH
jgi:yecA family protein